MELVLAVVALGVAALTLYSGFGLGTLLLPVLAIFYDGEVAVGATALVHLLNNLLKLALVGKHAHRSILWRFALPAIPCAFAGAALLGWLATSDPLATYELGSRACEITAIGLMIGGLVLIFAVLELTGALKERAFPPRLIPLGGALSGFFGGLSGHQGALRSMTLLRAGLTKEAYIGTGTAASAMVDFTRLAVYGFAMFGAWSVSSGDQPLRPLVVAIVFALLGTVLGTRLIGKITIDTLHRIVGILLLLAGIAIAMGISK